MKLRNLLTLASVAGFLVCGASHAGTLTTGSFSAGSGRADIVIPASTFPIDGFTGQHDPLAARVLLLDDGKTRLAMVVIDQTSISDPSIAAMKAIVTEVTGIQPDHVIVCASHGFSSPHVFPADRTPPELQARSAALGQAIDAAVRAAATQAVGSLQPAQVGFGAGVSHVGVSRDVPTPGGWWLGGNDAGYSDPTLGVLRLDRADGTPLAILMNYGVQSSVMDFSLDDAGQRLVSSDLAGVATRGLENHYGTGVVALFTVGAAGDQAPFLQANRHVVTANGSATRVDIHSAGFALLDLLGDRLGQDALAAGDAVQPETRPTLAIQRTTVQVVSQPGQPGGKPPSGPVASYDFVPGDKVDVPVVLIRIGDIAVVGLREELSASTGAWIRAHSPYAHTIVMTMVDGAAKYMPDAGSYDRITYEARSSRYARGSAETVAETIVAALGQMHGAPAR